MERFIIEKIAAGLRKVGKTPEMILVDVSWANGLSEKDVTDDKECPFIPVYKDRDEMDICHFRRGYDER